MSNQESNDNNISSTVTKKPRGFAAMDRDRVRAIAAIGGKAAHALGVGRQFNSEEARAAGRLGGIASQKSQRDRRSKASNSETEKTTESIEMISPAPAE